MPRPSELARVKRAAKTKRASEEEYRGALVAAHEAGFPFVKIAEAAGVSRQTVRIQVERAASRTARRA